MAVPASRTTTPEDSAASASVSLSQVVDLPACPIEAEPLA
jgi:hypothetical protein